MMLGVGMDIIVCGGCNVQHPWKRGERERERDETIIGHLDQHDQYVHDNR